MNSLKIITSILMSLLLAFAPTYNKQPGLNPNTLYAMSAAIIDGDSGRILYEKDGFTARPMASTTKIMTLIVALENCEDDEIVTVSEKASKMPDVQLNMVEGDTFYIGDLYYSLMLESHNDTACAIAEHVGGSVEGFADMMNKKAKEIGIEDAYFITPNGLDAEDENGVHSISATSLCRLMRYCVYESPKKDEFLAITQTKEKQFSNVSSDRIYYVSNKNKYLSMNPNCISGKTGFTQNAGYCYIGAVEVDGKKFIVALLGCGWPYNRDYKWKDMDTLINYANKHFEYTKVIDSDYKTGMVDVLNSVNEVKIPTYTDANLEILLGDNESVAIKEYIPIEIEAPVKKGEQIGYIDVIINDIEYARFKVFAGEGAVRRTFGYCLSEVVKAFLKPLGTYQSGFKAK